MNNGGLFYYFYFRKEQIFIIKFSNYNDIKNIIEKGLPRVIYLPWYIAKRLGNEVYINLLSHERFQCQRKLINDESISVLPIDEYDFLLSLISIAKEPENYIKVRGKYFNTDDILNDSKLRRMGYTKRRIRFLIDKMVALGYIAEVIVDEEIRYKLTTKTILPERPELKFKVIVTDLGGMQCEKTLQSERVA